METDYSEMILTKAVCLFRLRESKLLKPEPSEMISDTGRERSSDQ